MQVITSCGPFGKLTVVKLRQDLTMEENARLGLPRPFARVRKGQRRRLTRYEGDIIRNLYGKPPGPGKTPPSGWSLRKLAEAFEVSHETIRNAVYRKTWKGVKDVPETRR